MQGKTPEQTNLLSAKKKKYQVSIAHFSRNFLCAYVNIAQSCRHINEYLLMSLSIFSKIKIKSPGQLPGIHLCL